MNLNQRDQRAMAMLAVFLLLAGVIYWWPQESPVASAAPVTADEIELAQKRLLRLKQIGATLPGKSSPCRAIRPSNAASPSCCGLRTKPPRLGEP